MRSLKEPVNPPFHLKFNTIGLRLLFFWEFRKGGGGIIPPGVDYDPHQLSDTFVTNQFVISEYRCCVWAINASHRSVSLVSGKPNPYSEVDFKHIAHILLHWSSTIHTHWSVIQYVSRKPYPRTRVLKKSLLRRRYTICTHRGVILLVSEELNFLSEAA